MSVPSGILDFIVCPQCGGDLRYAKEKVLVCIPCQLCFPVEEGIPNLVLDAALTFTKDGKIIPRKRTAVFMIESEEEAGTVVRLEPGTCKAIGRQIEDNSQTQTFNMDFNMTLDDRTKQLIKKYVSKTSKQKIPEASSELGSFNRLPDLILKDPGVSRLHAMIFHDSAHAGILDLVSRNGTFVNGQEVETCLLKNGDEIRVGNTLLRFSYK